MRKDEPKSIVEEDLEVIRDRLDADLYLELDTQSVVDFDVYPGTPDISADDFWNYFDSVSLTKYRYSDWFNKCGCANPGECDTDRPGWSNFTAQWEGPYTLGSSTVIEIRNFGVEERWGTDGNAVERMQNDTSYPSPGACALKRYETRQFYEHIWGNDDHRTKTAKIYNRTWKETQNSCNLDQFTLTGAIRVTFYVTPGFPGARHFVMEPKWNEKQWNHCGYRWILTFVNQ
jgi:hypothetical protein